MHGKEQWPAEPRNANKLAAHFAKAFVHRVLRLEAALYFITAWSTRPLWINCGVLAGPFAPAGEPLGKYQVADRLVYRADQFWHAVFGWSEPAVAAVVLAVAVGGFVAMAVCAYRPRAFIALTCGAWWLWTGLQIGWYTRLQDEGYLHLGMAFFAYKIIRQIFAMPVVERVNNRRKTRHATLRARRHDLA